MLGWNKKSKHGNILVLSRGMTVFIFLILLCETSFLFASSPFNIDETAENSKKRKNVSSRINQENAIKKKKQNAAKEKNQRTIDNWLKTSSIQSHQVASASSSRDVVSQGTPENMSDGDDDLDAEMESFEDLTQNGGATSSESLFPSSMESVAKEKDILCKKDENAPSLRLHIGLLKEGTENFLDAIKKNTKENKRSTENNEGDSENNSANEAGNSENINKNLINDELKINGKNALIVRERKTIKNPSWVGFLQDCVDNQGNTTEHVNNDRTNSGLIFLETNERKFVFIFGNGRFLLKKGALDPHFGMRVALNNLDGNNPGSLKSFGKIIPGFNSVYTWKRYGKGTTPQTLQVGDSGNLKKLESKSEKRGKIAFEGSCVVYNAKLHVNSYPELCGRFLDLSQNHQYEKYFPDLDSFCPVEDEAKKNELNKKLVEIINAPANEKWTIDCPLHTDSENVVDEYIYEEESYNDVDNIYNILKSKKNITLNYLNKNKIECRWDDGSEFVKLYKAISCEVTLKGKMYALESGKWFSVNNDFNEKVNNYINPFFKSDPENLGLGPVLFEDLKLEAANGNNDPTEMDDDQKKNRVDVEQRYNRRIAQESKGDLLLFDCMTVKGDSSKDPHHLGNKFETCDLLSKHKHLIHVKDWSSSSTFSHLCAQAYASAKTLKDNRDGVLDRLRRAYVKRELKQILGDEEDLSSFGEKLQKITGSCLERDVLDKKITKIINDDTNINDNVKEDLLNAFKTSTQDFNNFMDPVNFKSSDYTVVMAFFHHDERGKLSDYLPYLSRVTLHNTIRDITEMGYKVEVRRIKRPEKSKKGKDEEKTTKKGENGKRDGRKKHK